MATGKVILYFIKDSYPTEEEFADAARYNTRMFRNASIADSDLETTEVCDAVAGSVPERYKKYPKAEPVIKVEKDPAPVSDKTQEQAPAQPWAK